MLKMLSFVALAGLCVLAPVAALVFGKPSGGGMDRAHVEQRFLEDQRSLLRVDSRLPETASMRRYHVRLDALQDHDAYLLPPADAGSPDAYIWIDGAGIVRQDGVEVSRMQNDMDWLVAADERRLVVDGHVLDLDLTGWDLHWATRSANAPVCEEIVYPAVRIYDGFMRTELADDLWQPASGEWSLKQHGGGMVDNEAEMANYSAQRAVNPFTVIGHGRGVLTCGDTDMIHVHAEARFFFGRPRLEKVIDRDSIPDDKDMIVLIGPAAGYQVGFGWLGAQRLFALVAREDDGPWQTLESWDAARPPATNWLKIGVELRHGQELVGLLDDVPVAHHQLDRLVAGPMHIASGEGMMEFDDVRAWSLPTPAPEPASVYARSRQFAGKKIKNRSDPDEFQNWARSEDTYLPWYQKLADGSRRMAIRSRQALYGDFYYESVPEDARVGLLPEGLYEYHLVRPDPADPLNVETGELIWRLRLERTATGWREPETDDLTEGMPPTATVPWPGLEHREFTLRFRRIAASGDRVEVQVDGKWYAVSGAFPGAVRLNIGRISSAGIVPPPHEEHHRVTSANLIVEFFEEAPSDWSWHDGAFRMDARWACQDQWNFMACSSTGVPYAASKRRFWGDQEHELFMSLRPNYPWEIGDTEFSYNPQTDKGFKIFHEHKGWYTRRDLNVSFCTDGVNPLSGYSVIFAGDDNERTMLLRKGEIVASLDATDDLIPKQENHGVIHWRWWQFRICKIGNRVIVYYSGEPLFDYTDPDPLPGGHIGFWSVRNGFTLSRVTSVADRIDTDPHRFYVHDDSPSFWRPLVHDTVTLTAAAAGTRVIFNSGTGFQAVRHDFPDPVDLAATPVLEMPLQVAADAQVNVHLQIGERSYLIAVNAPLTGIKSFITPLHDTGEQFQLETIPEATIRSQHLLGSWTATDGDTIRLDLGAALDALGAPSTDRRLISIAVGNTSNEGYLLAGRSANAAGAGYTVGEPVFRERSP